MTRRDLLRVLPAAGLTPPALASTKLRSRMRTLEGSGRVWDIWRIPNRFTKNPDVIRFPDGRFPDGRMMRGFH